MCIKAGNTRLCCKTEASHQPSSPTPAVYMGTDTLASDWLFKQLTFPRPLLLRRKEQTLFHGYVVRFRRATLLEIQNSRTRQRC